MSVSYYQLMCVSTRLIRKTIKFRYVKVLLFFKVLHSALFFHWVCYTELILIFKEKHTCFKLNSVKFLSRYTFLYIEPALKTSSSTYLYYKTYPYQRGESYYHKAESLRLSVCVQQHGNSKRQGFGMSCKLQCGSGAYLW